MATKAELKSLLNAPIPLAPNTYIHFYNGGKLRADFMGEANPKDDFNSEEWIFSTNRAYTPGRPKSENTPTKGYSIVQLPSGEKVLLTELLKAFPNETLGAKHFKKFGANLGVLVKIFDVGEGAHIPVHWHPSPQFAKKYLNNPFGKNESWILIGVRPGAKAWVGWKKKVTVDQFRKWMDAQDVEAMRAHMHEVKPKLGDVTYTTAGIVHSIGEGCCILEPQEPTDWNILAEYEGPYPYKREQAACGLDWDKGLEAADFSVMSTSFLKNRICRKPVKVRGAGKNKEEKFLPDSAKKYFWETKLTVADKMKMPGDRGFYVFVTFAGEGKLVGPWGETPIKRGKSFMIPRCLPGYEIVNTGSKPIEVYTGYPPKI